MNYRLVKENKWTLKNYGRYRAKAVHTETVDSRQIIEETARCAAVTEGAVADVVISLSEIISRHLRQGHRVRLDKWGLLKLEIVSRTVEQPAQFNPSTDIVGVRLHLIAESKKGRQPLYEDLPLTASD